MEQILQQAKPAPQNSALRAAFPATVPVLTGYICLGIAYGVLMRTAGYGLGWAVLLSILCYAGSMEFVTVTLLTSVFDPVQALIMSILVNARHCFYGLSILEKYKGTGWARPFLIFGLTYGACYLLRLPFDIAAPAGFIGASNFFELAVAVAIALFGVTSPAALATTVGVLTEVPVMLTLVRIANASQQYFRN